MKSNSIKHKKAKTWHYITTLMQKYQQALISRAFCVQFIGTRRWGDKWGGKPGIARIYTIEGFYSKPHKTATVTVTDYA